MASGRTFSQTDPLLPEECTQRRCPHFAPVPAMLPSRPTSRNATPVMLAANSTVPTARALHPNPARLVCSRSLT